MGDVGAVARGAGIGTVIYVQKLSVIYGLQVDCTNLPLHHYCPPPPQVTDTAPPPPVLLPSPDHLAKKKHGH